MFEQLNGPMRYDPDRLASLRFNPLLSETYNKFSLCSDHDRDANFFSELVDCEYYIEENLSLLHLNISLHGNLDNLTVLLRI